MDSFARRFALQVLGGGAVCIVVWLWIVVAWAP